MRGERVMLGEFFGRRSGRGRRQSLRLVQCGQFVELRFRILLELAAFLAYSPNAIETAPAARPAMPAVRIGPRSTVAAATPTTMPAVETIPSFAPSTPARSQFNFDATDPVWGSLG